MTGGDEGSQSMRMFGAVVRAARENAQLSSEELARRVTYSRSLIVKIERGERMPPQDFVPRAEELLRTGGMLREAAKHLSRERYPSWFEDYAEEEAKALVLNTYDTLLINGLLQTEAYTRAVLACRCPALDEDQTEHRVAARQARQSLLTRDRPAELSFIFDEWVLRRPLGGAAVLKEQLEWLLELGDRRHLSIQVVPMSYEAHAGVDGPMHLLETPRHQWLGYLEVQGRGRLIDDLEEVSELHSKYAMIRTQALTPGDSARLIEQIAGGP